MKRTVFILSFFCLIACTSKQELNERPTMSTEGPGISFFVSEPLSFTGIDDLRDYADGMSPQSKSSVGFVSYAETVMQLPGYDERPDAILSNKFGSILNAEGEVIVGEYFIKLFQYGLIIGSIVEKEKVRELSADSSILSLCGGKTYLPLINPNREVYEVEGFDNIYLYDLFNYLADADLTKEDMTSPVETKSPAAGLVTYNKTLGDLNMLLDPYADFTVPPAGSQKVYYDDSHCNDTKIWQKEYLVLMDRGLKTKTMQKGFLGTWSKYQNPVEGGILNWVIEENSTFNVIYGSNADINKIKYDDRSSVSHNIYTISARGQSLSSIMNVNLQQKINEGNLLATNNNLNLTIDGVRFVVSDSKAYTRFPNNTESANVEKIEKNWPTLFIGTASVNSSSVLHKDQELRKRIPYHTISAILYGQSTWNNNTTKGSKMVYHYN